MARKRTVGGKRERFTSSLIFKKMVQVYLATILFFLGMVLLSGNKINSDVWRIMGIVAVAFFIFVFVISIMMHFKRKRVGLSAKARMSHSKIKRRISKDEFISYFTVAVMFILYYNYAKDILGRVMMLVFSVALMALGLILLLKKRTSRIKHITAQNFLIGGIAIFILTTYELITSGESVVDAFILLTIFAFLVRSIVEKKVLKRRGRRVGHMGLSHTGKNHIKKRWNLFNISKRKRAYLILGFMIILITIVFIDRSGLVNSCTLEGPLNCKNVRFEGDIVSFDINLDEGEEDIYLILIKPSEANLASQYCYIKKGTVNPIIDSKTEFEVECNYSRNINYEYALLEEVGEPNSRRYGKGEIIKPFWR